MADLKAPDLNHAAELTELVVFRSELLQICTLAELAHRDLLTAAEGADHYRIWLAVHSFLVQAADASKILWPASKKGGANAPTRIARGERIRAPLSLGESHPLRSRALRNYFEHVDERIDEEIADIRKKGEGATADRALLSRRQVGVRRLARGITTLRSYDRAARVVLCGDDSVSIDELMSGFVDLRRRLEKIDVPIQVAIQGRSIEERQEAIDTILGAFQRASE